MPPLFPVERRRRDKINNWIVQLSKIIPDCSMESTKSGQVGALGTLCHPWAPPGQPDPPLTPPPPAEQRRDPVQGLRLHPGAPPEQQPPLGGAAGLRPAADGQQGAAAAGEAGGPPPRSPWVLARGRDGRPRLRAAPRTSPKSPLLRRSSQRKPVASFRGSVPLASGLPLSPLIEGPRA